MNIEIKHTIAFSPEVQVFLQSFLGERAQPVKQTRVRKGNETGAVEADISQGSAPAETNSPAQAANGADQLAEGENGLVVTVEQVREAVQTKSQAGHRETIKALLTKYGTPSVTKMEPARYPEFLKEVNAL